MIRLVAVLVLAATAASAQSAAAWTLDSLTIAQLKAAAADPANKDSFPSPVARLERIFAQSVGDNALPSRYNHGIQHENLWLMLNNTKDRVGAGYSVCGGGDSDDCRDLAFVFPELTVDRQRKVVLLGDEVVAQFRSRWSDLKLERGFQLRSETVEAVEDAGFDRVKVRRVRVYIERR